MTSLTIDDPQHKDYYNNVRFGEEAPVNDPAINREPGGMYEGTTTFRDEETGKVFNSDYNPDANEHADRMNTFHDMNDPNATVQVGQVLGADGKIAPGEDYSFTAVDKHVGHQVAKSDNLDAQMQMQTAGSRRKHKKKSYMKRKKTHKKRKSKNKSKSKSKSKNKQRKRKTKRRGRK
jgi:hypothetical protein